MDSLVESVHVTQGTAYLIAIALLFVFVALWILVNPSGRGSLVRRTVPLLAIAAGVGILAFAWVNTHGQTPPIGADSRLVNSSELVEMYGPAAFDHDLHQGIAEDCTVCHHKGGGTSTRCETCHGAVFDPADLSKPGLSRVFHLLCISCHKENQSGPADCTGCHTKASVPPLSVAHPLTGVNNCLGCHATDIAGVPHVPADHTGVVNGECQLCHKPLLEPTALARYELPHSVIGREDCLLCHGEGIAGAKIVPSDHAGRTNETCLICHGAPSVPASSVNPTAVPHEIMGRDDCLLCHGIDMSGISLVPADHAGRANSSCLYCHGLPHAISGNSDCLMCHERSLTCIGSDAMPANHVGFANDTCLGCHGVPHEVAGRWDCLLCHASEMTGLTPVPEDHSGRTNNTCLFCHAP